MKMIMLSNGGACRVSDEDFDRLSQFKWMRDKAGYARRCERSNGRARYFFMHREVIGAPPRVHVDHVDGDTLNNCRDNLRFCTSSQNQANRKRLSRNSRSNYRGVVFNKRCAKWQAQIKVLGRNIYLGVFHSEEDAAKAYDAAAIQHFGEFANPNINSDKRSPA